MSILRNSSALFFLSVALVWLCPLPNTAHASIPTTTTQKAKGNGQVFLRGQTARYRGTLLAGLFGYNLGHVPSRQLYQDLRKVSRTLRRYIALNRKHAPSYLVPTLVISGGLLAGGVASAFFSAANLSSMLLTIGLMSAIALAGLIWLAVIAAKHRKTPYYKKILTLRKIRRAIIWELRERFAARRTALLPRHQVTVAF